MSDPCIEAAQRAWAERYGPEMTAKYFVPSDEAGDVAAFVTAAAREALAPIRKLHTPIRTAPDYAYCDECDTQWPCDTAKLIYTTEELER